MKVTIPSPLLSYTKQQSLVNAEGNTVAELLEDLNRQFPGIRFRMIDEQDCLRAHMRVFVNGEMIQTLQMKLQSTDEVHLLQALSGG